MQLYDEDEMVLIAAPSHPLAARPTSRFSEALQYDFVSQHDSTSMNHLLAQAAAETGRTLKLRSLVRSYDGVCRMVAADFGLGLIPASFVVPNEFFGRLHVIRLEDAWAKRKLLTGVRDLETLPAAAKALRKHLSGPEAITPATTAASTSVFSA